MKIAVASHTFSADPLLREALSAHFPGAVFDGSGRMLEGRELVELLADSRAAILGLERIDVALIDQCPQLSVIAKFGVGLDNVDSAQLFGKTVGIIGLGHVGKKTAAVFRGVGCPVLGHDLLDLRDYCAGHEIRFAGLDEVLATSDFVSLHVPLTEATRGMIGARQLLCMKPTAFLLNTSRGGIVEEDALLEALERGQIAGAASDVFAEEPTRNTRLLGLESFIATPHVGGNSREAIRAVGAA